MENKAQLQNIGTQKVVGMISKSATMAYVLCYRYINCPKKNQGNIVQQAC